jgi:hypothetical protein
MLKRLLAVFTAMLLTLASYAVAQELVESHPTTYVVQKGDTLWDISARFLKKPWLWPEIWQANPQVKNPHLIYPGDVLSLVYIDGNRIQSSGPRAGEAITAIPLSDVEAFLKQLSVVDDVESLPYVVGLEEDRLLTSSGQLAYIRGMSGAQPGQLVQIARPINKYYRGSRSTHSAATDFRGDEFHRDWRQFWSDMRANHGNHRARGYVGTEMMRHATGEVTQVIDGVTVVLLQEEGRDVRVGDRVLPLPPPYDPYFYPSPPASAPANAHILAISDGLNGAGPRHVVALSVGAADGVKNGTTFSIWSDGAVRPDIVRYRNPIAAKHHKLAMPDDFIGHVMVFRTFDKVSYGLIMDGVRPASVGDLLKHPDAVN